MINSFNNLVQSRVIDMAPSATEEGEAEIMKAAKKKGKSLVKSHRKLIFTPSPVFEQSRRFKSRLDTGYYFMAPKIKCQLIFKGGLAVSTFFMITGFVYRGIWA